MAKFQRIGLFFDLSFSPSLFTITGVLCEAVIVTIGIIQTKGLLLASDIGTRLFQLTYESLFWVEVILTDLVGVKKHLVSFSCSFSRSFIAFPFVFRFLQIQHLFITIHMPQRTSKILLVRLTANKKASFFQTRETCFARYTVWFGLYTTHCTLYTSELYTMHCLNKIRFALVLRKIHFTLDDKLHFCGICIVMFLGRSKKILDFRGNFVFQRNLQVFQDAVFNPGRFWFRRTRYQDVLVYMDVISYWNWWNWVFTYVVDALLLVISPFLGSSCRHFKSFVLILNWIRR